MSEHQDQPIMPSDVSRRIGVFDQFAGWASGIVGRAVFFAFCVLLVVVWVPTIFLLHDVDTWQLIINTVTTIITFLMVALLENTHTRSDKAIQHKLNAIADGLADLMDHISTSSTHDGDLGQDMIELRMAVGLEEYEGTEHARRKRAAKADKPRTR
jgi:hypothetical protein